MMHFIGFLICGASAFFGGNVVPVPLGQKWGMFLAAAGIGWLLCTFVHAASAAYSARKNSD